MDDSVITCDEIIEETKTVATNFNGKNITSKTQNFHILLLFLLISIALVIAASIYYYLIKYRAKKKFFYHFVPQIANQNKLYIDNINQR